MVNKLIWLANIFAIVHASPINARAAFARAGISLSETDPTEDLAARQVISASATSLSSSVPIATATTNVVSAVSLTASQATLALGTTPSASVVSSLPGPSSSQSASVVSGPTGVPVVSSVAGSTGPPGAPSASGSTEIPGSPSRSVSSLVSGAPNTSGSTSLPSASSKSTSSSISSATSISVSASAPASSIITSSGSSLAATPSSGATSAISQSAGASSIAVTSSAAVATGAAAVASVDLDTGINSNPDAYTFFKGDGSSGAGWPTKDKWISFNEMFTRNSKVMGKGCVDNVTPNTDAENTLIKTAATEIATAAKIDPRFVLAIIMQESNGCVRIKRTGSGEAGVINPGLMQSFNGTGTCNINNTKEVNPCGANQITQMLIDGAQGTLQSGVATGGLVQHINAVGGDASGQNYFKAARVYNSGSVAADGLLETAGQCGPPRSFGVPCYSSDIANRMMGWVSAPTACTLKPAVSC